MTANHPEALVARLDDIILDELLYIMRPGAELQMAARQARQAVLNSGLLVPATLITSLVGERDAWRLASEVGADALSEATTLHCNALVKLQAAESTIRNRDETIAALRAALEILLASVDGVLVELKPGQSLRPAGAGRTNALESDRNAARRVLASVAIKVTGT